MTSNAKHAVEMLDTMLSFSNIPHVLEHQDDALVIAYPSEILGDGRIYTVAQIGDPNDELVVFWDDVKLMKDTCKPVNMSVLQAYARILYHYLRDGKKKNTI